MAGIAHREDPLDVFNHLQHNLIWLSMPSGLTMDLAINILGKYKKYCRTGYWFSKTTVFLEIVGKGTAVIDKIIALTGLQEIGGMARFCYIEQASKRINPRLISEYACLLVSGEARLMHLTPNQIYFNSQWEGNPNRIPTPTIPNQSEISDIPPKSDTPQDFVNVQPRRKIRPSADEKPDFSTPIGPPLPDFNKTFPPNTIPRTGTFIPNICTPSTHSTPTGKPKPTKTPEIPTPLRRPLKGKPPGDGTGQNPSPPPIPVPKQPLNPLDPRSKPEKSTPIRDPPQIPRFTNPFLGPYNITGKPLQPQFPSLPDNANEPLDKLRFIIPHLDTEELHTVISDMIRESKRRIGEPIPGEPAPQGQGHGDPLGGKVGDAGGLGLHEPGLGVSNQGKVPDPHLNITHPLHITNPFYQDLVREDISAIPQPPEYSLLQTSLQAMSEGLLKTILKEGILRKDTPKLPVFTGKPGDEKTSWRRWELQVKGLEGSYTDKAIKEAMNKALQGDAAIVADSLDDDCTWQELLKALKAKFAIVSSQDVMMKTFFDISQGSNNVSQFAIQLEKVLGNIRVCHPESLTGREFSNHLRNRFFHGLSETYRGTLRYKFDQGCSYEDLLLSARQVEGEKIGNVDTVSDSSIKSKAKAAVVQQTKAQPSLGELQQAYRITQGEVAKFQSQMNKLTKLKDSLQVSSISSHAPSTTGANGRQQQPQTPAQQPTQTSQPLDQSGKGYNNPGYSQNWGRGRGGRGRGGGPRKSIPDPPGRPKGWSRLCYWCREFVPFEQANHLIRDCPFYKQGKEDWWSMQPGHTSTPNPNPSQNHIDPATAESNSTSQGN